MTKKEIQKEKNQKAHLERARRDSTVKTFITVGFWAFVIVTTAILLLFSDGYSFSFKDQKITQNGTLTINSKPDNATVYLDGKRRGSTNLYIPSLKPGIHTIEIKKDGYAVWSESINLEKQKAIEINALLFKTGGQKEVLSKRNVNKLSFAPNADSFIFTEVNEDKSESIYFRPFVFSIWDFNRDEVEVFKIIDKNATLNISPEGAYTLIKSSINIIEPTQGAKPNQDYYYIVENIENATPTEISDLDSFANIKNVSWPATGENRLLIETETQLISYDIQTKQAVFIFSFPKDTKPIYTTTKLGNLIFINPSDKLPYSITLQGTNRQLLVNNPNENTFGETSEIIADKQEKFILINSSNQITFIETVRPLKETQVVKPLITDNSFNEIDLGSLSGDSRWLYFTEQSGDLYVYDLVNINKAETKNPSIRLVKAINSDDIEPDQIFVWHPNNINLLTLPIRKSGIAAIKSFNAKNNNYQVIYKNYLVSPTFGISRDGDKVIFLENVDGEKNLQRLDLLDNEVINIGLLR